MVEKAKRQRKGTICEEDVPTLLKRYPATTVLALLQEVAQVQDVKIDWNDLVKKTLTGISNAREYQMLWRHLAYRHALAERLDNGAEPMDDDSDLDYELEAIPPVSSEASTEAAAYVKVMIASGLQSDAIHQNGATVQAPLTINIPNVKPSSRASSENSQLQGTNITVPVSVQKQPLPLVASAEVLDANGSASGNQPTRKKRKPWTEAEDLELIAAVQKCGEGNWANILKGDFKGDRTASQLSQRWGTIRKKQGNLNVGGSSQLSEAQLAARRAVSLALNMPMVDNLTAACSTGTGILHASCTVGYDQLIQDAVEASTAGALSQHQPQHDFAPSTSSKSRVTARKPSPKPALSPDAMVKAAAVAAGARIATPSDAASLLKAAQSKNAVHIIPGGGSLIKSSVAGNSSALPPNVHFIRTGLVVPPSSTYSTAPNSVSRPGGAQSGQNTPKPVVQTTQLNPTRNGTDPNPSTEATNVVTSSTSGSPPKEQFKDDQIVVSGNPLGGKVEEARVVVSGDNVSSKEKVQEQASISGNSLKEHIQDPGVVSINAPNEPHQGNQTALPNLETTVKRQNELVENSLCSSSLKTGEDHQIVTNKEVTAGSKETDDNNKVCLSIEEGETKFAVEQACQNQNLGGKQADLLSIVRDAIVEHGGVVG
ncbi:Telomeric repeat-binding factor like [Actinidia chinensis var. chinensis]|uniref:Telomeric repeat-binding factor like n=1 Tax=Actinidia chinensis var. chinensis TaxID=1590841 RepID=A0A2R6QYC7_ACTCC|nr:Telomeric repeat-binding factor like [Actinidia chinensis var. chinensis]